MARQMKKRFKEYEEADGRITCDYCESENEDIRRIEDWMSELDDEDYEMFQNYKNQINSVYRDDLCCKDCWGIFLRDARRLANGGIRGNDLFDEDSYGTGQFSGLEYYKGDNGKTQVKVKVDNSKAHNTPTGSKLVTPGPKRLKQAQNIYKYALGKDKTDKFCSKKDGNPDVKIMGDGSAKVYADGNADDPILTVPEKYVNADLPEARSALSKLKNALKEEAGGYALVAWDEQSRPWFWSGSGWATKELMKVYGSYKEAEEACGPNSKPYESGTPGGQWYDICIDDVETINMPGYEEGAAPQEQDSADRDMGEMYGNYGGDAEFFR